MNVSQRYPDTEVLPIPSVHCFASTLPAQSELSSIFDLMEMSPQHRGMQGLSLRRKTDTGVRKAGNLEVPRFSSIEQFDGGIVNFLALKILSAERGRLCTKRTALCVALLAAPLYGQSDFTATSQGTVSYGAAAVAAQGASDLQMQNPYLGGVPAGNASETSLSLSLEDAVTRGLRQGRVSGVPLCFSHVQDPQTDHCWNTPRKGNNGR
jgi:hypothetical protein